MRKILITAALVVLAACATPFQRTTEVSGTGSKTPDRYRFELRVQNNNWLTAKVYVVPASSPRSTGWRAATVSGPKVETVQAQSASAFLLRVKFVGSREVWYSEAYSPGQPCLEIVISEYIPATYVLPCRLGRSTRR